MEKKLSFHYSVTENAKIQVRLVKEYIKGERRLGKKYGDPYTPKDTNDMTGWDDRSRDIVTAITDPKVLADFEVEKQEPTGVGIEEIVTYDRVVDDLVRISIRQITRIYDEGKEVSKEFHRSWIMPGDDPSNADVISKALAKKLHTPEVIEKYKKKQKDKEKS